MTVRPKPADVRLFHAGAFLQRSQLQLGLDLCLEPRHTRLQRKISGADSGLAING